MNIKNTITAIQNKVMIISSVKTVEHRPIAVYITCMFIETTLIDRVVFFDLCSTTTLKNYAMVLMVFLL